MGMKIYKGLPIYSLFLWFLFVFRRKFHIPIWNKKIKIKIVFGIELCVLQETKGSNIEEKGEKNKIWN